VIYAVGPRARTHTHTHMHTHIYTHIHTQTHTHTHVYTYTHTHAYTQYDISLGCRREASRYYWFRSTVFSFFTNSASLLSLGFHLGDVLMVISKNGSTSQVLELTLSKVYAYVCS